MTAYTVLPLDRWRAATAGLIQETVGIDTVFFTALIDASSAEMLRERHAGMGISKPTYTAIVVKAISNALREHPEMNRLILPRWPFRFRPVQLHEVHAVVAVERVRNGEDSVYAGIIRHSDRKPALEIAEEMRKLSTNDESGDSRLNLFMRLVRTMPGFLSRWIIGLPRWGPQWWITHRGGSFALTTVGKYGVDSVCVKWPWPLTFTFGEVRLRPLVVNDTVAARPSFYLTMGWRRDLCNGAPAARFFKRIQTILACAAVEMAPGAAEVPAWHSFRKPPARPMEGAREKASGEVAAVALHGTE